MPFLTEGGITNCVAGFFDGFKFIYRLASFHAICCIFRLASSACVPHLPSEYSSKYLWYAVTVYLLLHSQKAISSASFSCLLSRQVNSNTILHITGEWIYPVKAAIGRIVIPRAEVVILGICIELLAGI